MSERSCSRISELAYSRRIVNMAIIIMGWCVPVLHLRLLPPIAHNDYARFAALLRPPGLCLLPSLYPEFALVSAFRALAAG